MDNNPQSVSPQPTHQANSQKIQPKGLAIAALVVGIFSLVFAWTGIFAFLPATAAIILGAFALKKKQHKVMSLIGLILGTVALLIAIAVTVITVSWFSSAANDYKNIQTDNNSSKNLNDSTKKPKSGWTDAQFNDAFTKITTGMTKAEVATITGKPSPECTTLTAGTTSREMCKYGGDYEQDAGRITITYEAGKVQNKVKSEFTTTSSYYCNFTIKSTAIGNIITTIVGICRGTRIIIFYQDQVCR